MFFFDGALTAELQPKGQPAVPQLEAPQPQRPRTGSAYESALKYRGIVAVYASDDFGYIIRRSVIGEYHFVYFCAGRHDTMSAGYASKQEAIQQAYLDSSSRGLKARIDSLEWLQSLKRQSEGLSKLPGELSLEPDSYEALGENAQEAQSAALSHRADPKPSASTASAAPSPRELARARFADSLVDIYGDDDRGYLIFTSVTGRYRFMSYSAKNCKLSPRFATELKALRAAHDDCQHRVPFYWNLKWVSELQNSILNMSREQ